MPVGSLRSEPTGTGWIVLGRDARSPASPGAIVQAFIAGEALNVGDEVVLSTDMAVRHQASDPAAPIIGRVVGGKRTKFVCASGPEDIGVLAASSGQYVLVCILGTVYKGTSPLDAALTLVAPGALAVQLPGDGRTTNTLSQVLLNNFSPVIDVEDYNARVTATAAVNTAAINAAALEARALGRTLRFSPGKVYSVNDTLLIQSAVQGIGAILNYVGPSSKPAIQVGATYNGVGEIPFIQNTEIHLPGIANNNKTALGWGQAGVLGTIGVKVQHVYNSTRITIPYVANFETNLLVFGEHDGSDYNQFALGNLYNGKVNLKLDATSDGWANHLAFNGGRLNHDPAEGTRVAGTRQIQVLGSTTTTDILNGHQFNELSLEGDAPEYHVETKGAVEYYINCRWETSPGINPRFLSSGPNTIGNKVIGGYNAHFIDFLLTGGAGQPRIETRDKLVVSGASNTDAVLELVNHDSSASPLIWAYKAGQDVGALDRTTKWILQMTALGLQGKADTDAVGVQRLFLEWATGIATFAKIISQLFDPGSQQPILNGATGTLMTGFTNGFIIIAESNTANSALLWYGSGGPSIIVGDAAHYGFVAGVAGKFNVFTSGGNLVLQNLRGADASISKFIFRFF